MKRIEDYNTQPKFTLEERQELAQLCEDALTQLWDGVEPITSPMLTQFTCVALSRVTANSLRYRQIMRYIRFITDSAHFGLTIVAFGFLDNPQSHEQRQFARALWLTFLADWLESGELCS